MATENEQIIIDVVPELSLNGWEKDWAKFASDTDRTVEVKPKVDKKGIAKLRSEIREALRSAMISGTDPKQLDNTISAISGQLGKALGAATGKEITVGMLDAIKTQKREVNKLLKSEAFATELGIGDPAKVARLTAKQEQLAAAINSVKVSKDKLAKSTRDNIIVEDRLNKQVEATRTAVEKLKDKAIILSHFFDIGKISASQYSERIAELQKQLNRLNGTTVKAPIGALGVQVAPSGAFSSLATKQTYSSASDFKANASMEAIAKAAIAQSARLGKQAAHEFNNSFLGSFMSGSSFGHKLGTTLQYTMAGTGIFAAASAIVSIKDAVVEADKAIGMFNAVLFGNEKTTEAATAKSRELQQAIFTIGTTYGGQISELNESALALGRAGIAGNELADSIKAVSQVAALTGDPLSDITSTLVSWHTLYPEKTMTQLADSMTGVSNATLMSMDDLKTMTTYVLTAGQTAGMSAEGILALSGAWRQIGKAASTAATEQRRFYEQVTSGTDDVKKAWMTLGVNVDTFADSLRKSPEAAMQQLMNTLKTKTPAEIEKAMKELANILDKETMKSMLKMAQTTKDGMTLYEYAYKEGTENVQGLTEKGASEIALTYEKMWERVVNSFKSGSSAFENAFKDGFAGQNATQEEFNEKLKEFDKLIVGIAKTVGNALGSISSFIVDNRDLLITALEVWATYGALVGGSKVLGALKNVSSMFTALRGPLQDVTKYTWSATSAIGSLTPPLATATAQVGFATKGVRVLTTAVKANPLFWGASAIILGINGITYALEELFDTEKERDAHAKRTKAYHEGQEAYYKSEKYALDEVNKYAKPLYDRLISYEKGLQQARKAGNKEAVAAYELSIKNTKAQLKAYEDASKYIKNPKDSKPSVGTLPPIGSGSLDLKDDNDSESREAQRKAQDALDIELARIRKTFEAEETKHKKLGTFNEKVQKDLKLQEETQLRIATEKAKGVDDHTKKVLKAQEAELKAQGEVYELANKANKEAAKKASITLADNRILQATNEYTKASAELSKAKLEAELVYNEELEKVTSEAKAKALQEESINKATVEYQNKILELDKKRAQERIKLQQDTSSMLEENKTQQQAITDEYLKFLGYSERALELEQLKANVAKETRSIYSEQEAALASKYAGDKDVDTNAQTTVDDSVIQKLSTINDKELQRLALMEYQAEFQKAFASGLDGQSINLDGILSKYQAIADKISNLKLKVDIEISKDGFEPLKRVEKYISGVSSAMSEGGPKAKDYSDELSKLSGTARENLQKEIDAEEKRKAKNKALNDQILKFSSAGLNTTEKVKKAQELAAEAEKKYGAGSKESNEANLESISNQAGAYGALAGAAAGFFEEGSKGAKAMQAIQATLGIISGISAITRAWSDPYPLNLVTVPLTTAAVLPMIGQLTSLGGSGGGVGGASVTAPDVNFDLQRSLIESDYTPITDILNRHTDLLESIERNGSASQLGVKLAGSEFTRDYRTWVEDTLEKARTGSVSGGASTAELERVASIVENAAGFDFYDVLGGNVKINLSALREGFNLIDALVATLATGGWGTLGQADITDFNSPTAWVEQTGSIRGSLNEVQNLINDWAMSVVESMHDLTDSADEFRGYFDSITGSMFYETTRLKQAFDDVDRLRGDRSFSSYLQDTITNIDNLEKFFTDETFALLMSDSLEDIQDQIQAINELSAVTGETFEGGAREALDYLESINLVAEAMAASRENIRSFTESLFDDRLSALNMASSLGVTSLATDTEQLADIFYRLSGDMDGLTDSDMRLLNANLELLKSTDTLNDEQERYNDTLNEVAGSISTLNNALSSIQSTIDKLRGAAGGAEYTMEMFRQSMSKALSLKGTTNYEDFAKAVQEATGYSSALMDSSNFEFSRDQKFAQAVAANQFEALEDATLSQIDYLKMIEENTRAQVSLLADSINNLSSTIDSELIKSIQERDPNTGYIASKYQEVLGRAADEAGLAYWANQVASGAVSQSGLGIAIGAAGVANGEISRAQYVAMLYSKGLGRTGTPDEINYWANKSSTPTTALASMFAQLDPNFQSFAKGTQEVPYDMIAQIHKGEAIVPKPQAEAWRNGRAQFGMNTDGIITAINNLGSRMASVEKVLNDSRDIQSGCLETLQLIEEVS